MGRTDINAWREIVARIFDGIPAEENITPPWLINPDTNRPLKLDLLYPDIGVAVRFQGLRGQQQRGPVSWHERVQQRKRDENRDKVCADHGINLASLDLKEDEPRPLLTALEYALSDASRRLAKDTSRSEVEIETLRDQVRQARSRVSDFRRKIETKQDLTPYFDLWRDRQFRLSQGTETVNSEQPPATLPSLEVDMLVDHTLFGVGTIKALEPSGDDTLVTIEFLEEGKKTFLASLLGDKVDVA